jgi:hypothetical protein
MVCFWHYILDVITLLHHHIVPGLLSMIKLAIPMTALDLLAHDCTILTTLRAVCCTV